MAEAREALTAAPRVLVVTGAGISAESGIPTFRGAQGLWRRFRAEELATPEAFRRDPRLVWEWYAWRREIIRGCRPNAGHLALARWLLRRRASARLATQNVDGLHARAAREEGASHPDDGSAADVLELHGSLFRVRCPGCGLEEEDTSDVDTSSEESLPRCTVCRSLLRPAVVWFGETLPREPLDEAVRWAREADVTLVVGTSALVHPAASLPHLTLGRGGLVLEVNLEISPLTPVAHLSLQGPAGRILPEILGTREPPRV